MAQRAYDPLDYIDAGVTNSVAEAQKMARRARDMELRDMRATVKQYPHLGRCHGWTLANQIRSYRGLGQPDGSVRNVYYITAPDEIMPFGKAQLA